MRKTSKNLYLLYMVFCMALITSNCIASKVFDTGIVLWGAPVTLTVGAICYPITFLVTDIIGELWGKKEASFAVTGGFICQIFSTVIVNIARILPPVDAGVQASYVTVMGSSWVFVAASLCAYLASQKCDLIIFHTIRERYLAKHGSTTKGKWIYNNVATITSQFLDSIIYVLIAFGLGFGWLWNAEMHITLLNMIMGQWAIKIVFALIDTPLFYFFTRKGGTQNVHS